MCWRPPAPALLDRFSLSALLTSLSPHTHTQVMISSNNFASVFVSPKLPANSCSCQHGGTNTSVKDKAIISKHSLFLPLPPPNPWAAVSIFLLTSRGGTKDFFPKKNHIPAPPQVTDTQPDPDRGTLTVLQCLQRDGDTVSAAGPSAAPDLAILWVCAQDIKTSHKMTTEVK